MNHNKGKIVWLTVGVNSGYVVVDGPNVYTDRYCLSHKLRQCKDCMIQSKWKMDDPKYWDRTLDIERLPIVSEYVRSRGYRPRIFILDSTHDWIIRNRKQFLELMPKLKILDKMIKKKEIILLSREKWRKGGKVVDDIWWITFALEIDALILTNDNLKDWRGKRQDLDWNDIENRKIGFSFEPRHAKWNKFGDECEEQVFTAAELERLAEMNPVQKMEVAKLERRKLLERASELEILIESLAKTTAEEISEEHDFLGYEGEIIDAWLAAFEVKDGALGSERTMTVWRFVVGYICGLDWHQHINDGGDMHSWTNHQKYDEEISKKRLGYSTTESHIRILENQFNLLEERTEKRFKFSPDQENLLFLNAVEDFNENGRDLE